MRVLSIKFGMGFFSFLIWSLLLACDQKPKIIETPNGVEPPFLNYKGEGPFPKGLWFTGVNFVSGGYLGRLDLKTGEIKRKLLRIGPDTIVVPDSTWESLFVLSRGGQESMAKVKNINGEIEVSRSLPALSNPQAVVSDLKGQVWVSFLELNEVHVYSKDLKSLVAQVDLSSLALKGSDNHWHADLGPMALIDENTILVAAERLHRDQAWAPDSHAGLAFINTNNYQVESTHLIGAANPVYIGTDPLNSRVLVVGKGDLSLASGIMGQFLFFNKNDLATAPLHFMSGKIIDADFVAGADFPALIVWYPQENKSCIQIGSTPLLCDGHSENNGYVFSAIRQIGNIIFVAYYGNQSSELWMITHGAAAVISVQKIPMDLPIFSLSFGP